MSIFLAIVALIRFTTGVYLFTQGFVAMGLIGIFDAAMVVGVLLVEEGYYD